jgi:hypothetical protein
VISAWLQKGLVCAFAKANGGAQVAVMSAWSQKYKSTIFGCHRHCTCVCSCACVCVCLCVCVCMGTTVQKYYFSFAFGKRRRTGSCDFCKVAEGLVYNSRSRRTGSCDFCRGLQKDWFISLRTSTGVQAAVAFTSTCAIALWRWT